MTTQNTSIGHTTLEQINGDDGLTSQIDPERRKQVEKRLKLKLELRGSFYFVLIYTMNYLDRNTIATARLGGLQEDLDIDDTQYATCLSIIPSSWMCAHTGIGG